MLTDLALGFRGRPPTCSPAPSPPKRTRGKERHRPFSHQKTRLYISSETSESNRDCCFFSLCGMRPPAPHYFTSPFLALHFSTQSCPQPLALSPRSSSDLRPNAAFPLSCSTFSPPSLMPLWKPLPSWKPKSQLIYTPPSPLGCQNIYLRTFILFTSPHPTQLFVSAPGK